MQLLGNQFLIGEETTTATHKDILHSEMLCHKCKPPIAVDENHLQWWATHGTFI